jgi:hypothetical protein
MSKEPKRPDEKEAAEARREDEDASEQRRKEVLEKLRRALQPDRE